MLQTAQECTAPFFPSASFWYSFLTTLTTLAGCKSQQASFRMGSTQSCPSLSQLSGIAFCHTPGICGCVQSTRDFVLHTGDASPGLSVQYQVCVACNQLCVVHIITSVPQVQAGHACIHLHPHMHVNVCATVNKRCCRRGGTRFTQYGFRVSNGLAEMNPGLQTQSPPTWI
jgi:hypothetical protein